VIEASSYQIEYSKYFKTDYAIILNVSPNHLERHRTFKNYIKSKSRLIKSQKKNSFAFIEKNNNFFVIFFATYLFLFIAIDFLIFLLKFFLQILMFLKIFLKL